MIDGKRVLAIVPARAGSKGLPGKNVRMLAGKPLLAWPIAAARASAASRSAEACSARLCGTSRPMARASAPTLGAMGCAGRTNANSSSTS